MEVEKGLGIWMDHSEAFLIEYTKDSIQVHAVESTFKHADENASISKSENIFHNKEQQKQAAYFKGLSDEISKHTDVLLFGPTDAKVEFFNVLREDKHFDAIKIGVKPADKMTENQRNAFVRDYFSAVEA